MIENTYNTDWSWLAGIIDGEGCITFHKNRSGKLKPTPVISVSNTSYSMILKIIRIIEETGIEYNLQERHRNNSKWKMIYVIRIDKLISIKTFLESIVDYLTAKKEQAKLVLESIIVSSLVKRYKKSEARIPFANKVWELNKKGKGQGVSIGIDELMQRGGLNWQQ